MRNVGIIKETAVNHEVPSRSSASSSAVHGCTLITTARAVVEEKDPVPLLRPPPMPNPFQNSLPTFTSSPFNWVLGISKIDPFQI